MNKTSIIILVVILVAIGAVLTYSSIPHMTNSTQNLTAQDGDMVSVLYTGKLQDGTVFDASANHGNQPLPFVLGAGTVIPGWDQGIVGMKVGEKKTLTIPPALGYGAQGVPDGQGGYLIPPNSTLVFDVQLVDIKRK